MTPTSSPSDSPTPDYFINCRSFRANKRKKNCLRIPGCRWRKKKCEPIPPTAEPTSAPTPASWLACRRKKANKRKKFCLKIPGCIWRKRKCLHRDSL
jgi:hypothetical protein